MLLRPLIVLLFGIIICSCADSDTFRDNQSEESNVESAYLSFSIKAPENPNSRANEETWWEDGREDENHITSVRFYFFDNSDILLKVKLQDENNVSSGHLSYYDWMPAPDSDINSTVSSSSDGNYEKKFTVNLKLDLEQGKTPVNVVAVLNANPYIKNLDLSHSIENASSPFTLHDLKEIIANFQEDESSSPSSSLTSTGTFVMSNSTYLKKKDGIKYIITPVSLGEEDIYASEEEAKKHPIDIYVERVVSRIDLKFNASLKQNEDLSSIKIGQYNIGGEKKEIYVNLLGWAVTSSPKFSRLLKSISSGWDESSFFSSKPWNSETYHRSFWSINPDLINPVETYYWYSYNNITGRSQKIEEEDISADDSKVIREKGCYDMEISYAYMQENSNPYSTEDSVEPKNPTYPTKVICAAQLVDVEGNPVEFAEYDSKYYTLSDLKAYVQPSLDMWSQSEVDGENKYIQITPDDLNFETSMAHANAQGPDDAKDTYLAYFVLSEEAAKKQWFHKADLPESGNEPDISKKINVKTYLDSQLFPAKVWRNGYSYYFFDILHYGEKPENPGYVGVVRNHIYEATIEKISSLGTPVWNPDEVIYPELPPHEDKSLQINIKVVQWRFVRHHLQLAW